MGGVDVHVVGIAGPVHDYPVLVAERCRQLGLHCSVDTIPFVPVGEFNLSIARTLKAMLQAAPAGSFTVYMSGWAEYYLAEADLSLHFSLYRRWFDRERMRVLPYAWTNARPDCVEDVAWQAKPSASVGFRGMSYAGCRAPGMLTHLPRPLKRGILQGHHLRYPRLFAAAIDHGLPVAFAATFARFEALAALSAQADRWGLEVEIEDTGIFRWSAQAVDAFERHLLRNTYILCPRGAENFSFRVYEALRFGRVPVIVDTDMVLPPEVPWSDVALCVPYDALHHLAAIVADDHRSRTEQQFRARQRLALDVSDKLDSGAWLTGIAREIGERVDARARVARKTTDNTIKSLDSAPVF